MRKAPSGPFMFSLNIALKGKDLKKGRHILTDEVERSRFLTNSILRARNQERVVSIFDLRMQTMMKIHAAFTFF